MNLFRVLEISADSFSLNGYEGASVSSMSSIKDANHEDINFNAPSVPSNDRKQKGLELGENVVINSANTTKRFGSQDDISGLSVDEGTEREEGGILDNCGILPNNCLPCLASTAPSIEKKISQTSSPPHLRKKAALKLSFKWRAVEGHTTSPLRECLLLHFIFWIFAIFDVLCNSYILYMTSIFLVYNTKVKVSIYDFINFDIFFFSCSVHMMFIYYRVRIQCFKAISLKMSRHIILPPFCFSFVIVVNLVLAALFHSCIFPHTR